MNYDHGFHAGNPADVLKHALLVMVLEELLRKEGALGYVDTHAGAGLYPLDDPTGEWTQGIGRLVSRSARRRLPELRRYLDLVVPEDGTLESYPGSPALAQAMLGPDDLIALYELNPRDAERLEERLRLSRDRRVRLELQDGYEGLLRLRRPEDERLLVLIDPPFEALDEWDRLESTILRLLAKRPSTALLLWYPTKIGPPHTGRPEQLVGALAEREGRGLRVEFKPHGGLIRPRRDLPKPRGSLTGSGLLSFNCPPRALARFMAALPELGRSLGRPEERSRFELVVSSWG